MANDTIEDLPLDQQEDMMIGDIRGRLLNKVNYVDRGWVPSPQRWVGDVNVVTRFAAFQHMISALLHNLGLRRRDPTHRFRMLDYMAAVRPMHGLT